MSDTAGKPFPSYLEVPAQLPEAFWWTMRCATIAVTLMVVWVIATNPSEGLALFWKVIIPSLPMVFAVVPGIWRQICPMAFLNQLPRTFGFSLEKTLPVRLKNIAYFISVLLFFVLVSLRHIYFNSEPAALLVLIVGALALSFLGGILYKGRSGWCGTFCPLAPIQKAYGHAAIFSVRNGYCPTCVGCQKNCFDFNPRAAFLSDLSDKDLWYAGHKKFFVAGLPGFAIGFFTAQNPAVTGLGAYYLYLAGWIVTTLGVYMAARIFIRTTDYRAAGVAAMSALVIFYWFAGPGIVGTLAGILGLEAPEWAGKSLAFLALAVAVRVLANGFKAERAFQKLNDGGNEPKVSVRLDAVRSSGDTTVPDLISELRSGRSFAVDPSRTLLEGLESAGVAIDFGCRMGMCGADPIAVVGGTENLSPPSDDERATLRRLGLEGRARMACVCKATGGGVAIDLGVNPNDLPEPAPPADQVDWGQASGVRRVVIIGNGTSGMAAADEIRRLSASCKIDVLAAENHQFYNRMAIGRLIYGRTGLDDLYLLSSDWYAKKAIDVWLNTRAVAIARESKEVKLGTGEALPYDKLVLAMGARAVMPPAEGSELPGCFVLREASDAYAIRAWRQTHDCQRAVVLGGGVLGIEAADALRRLNLKTTIIQRSDRLMNRELDEKGSAILAKYLEGLGVEVILGASIARLSGDDRLRRVELTNGTVIDAQIYVTCAGVTANSELAAEAGLEVGRGVIVDRSMRTSDPDIVASGDVAELADAVGGLWSVGTAQAAVAAATIFGRDATYEPPSTLVSLKMDGIDVKGFGKLKGGDGVVEIADSNEPENVRRRLFVKDGHIVGAVFVGPPGIGQDLAQAIQKKANISAIVNRLQAGDWASLGSV